MSQAINYFTRVEYKGKNQMSLVDGEYATFLQWKDGGFKVKKGEKGSKIIKVVRFSEKDKKTNKVEDKAGVKYYTVFEKNQVEKV